MGAARGLQGTGLNSVALGSSSLHGPRPLICFREGALMTMGAGQDQLLGIKQGRQFLGHQAVLSAQDPSRSRGRMWFFFHLFLRNPLGQR